MTEIDALKKCIKVWTWLANNVGKSKRQAYECLNLDRDLYNCALCDYAIPKVGAVNITACVDMCPLYGKWSKNDKSSVCTDPDGYFEKWTIYFDKFETSFFLKRYYSWKMKSNAYKIVFACEDRLREIEDGK